MNRTLQRPLVFGYKKWIALAAACLLAACHEVPKAYPVALTSTLVSGRLLLNSAPYSGDAGDVVNLERGALSLLAKVRGGDGIELGALGEGGYQFALLDGTYLPFYRYQAASVLPASNTETITPSLPKVAPQGDLVIVSPPTESASGLPTNPEAILPNSVDTADPSSWDVDVPAVTLELHVQLNGADFPASGTEVAQIYLQSQNSDKLISLGTTNTPLQSVVLTPGKYDVIYQYISGLRIPQNTHHLLHTIHLTNATVASIRKEVNVQSIDIRARFSLDGGDFPDSAYDYGLLSLQNGLDRVQLGRSYEQVASARVIPGDYAAHYSAREPGSLTPINPDAIIKRDVVIDSKSTILELNVATAPVRGNFLVNGEAPPASAYEYGRVRLRNADTGASLLLGDTYEQGFNPIRVIPGNYQFEYEFREGGDVLPVNQHVILPDVLIVPEVIGADKASPALQLDCNIPVVTLSAALMLNGEPFPNSAYDYADIVVRRSGGEQDIALGHTYDRSSSARIIPGDYDAFYRMRESTGIVPANSNYRFVSAQSIDKSVTLEQDFRTRSIQLFPTLNGEGFPASAYRYAELAVGSQADERIVTNTTYAEGDIVKVITGNYAVYYSAKEIADGLDIPVNRDAKVAEISVE